MKKLLSLLIISIAFATSCVFVSCEKNDDVYYAGESEWDYKPATYTITSEWDFSKVEGLTSEQKASLQSAMNNSVTATEVFDSRADAVAAFDEVVVELQYAESMSQYKGLKAKLYLKRDKAVIKSATLEW